MTDYDISRTTNPPTPPPTQERARAEAEHVARTARHATSDVQETAAEAARQTLDEAKYSARSTYEEARIQAHSLLETSKSELSSQAGSQQDRLAGTLHSFGDELDSMALTSTGNGMATDLARRTAGMAHDAGRWLEVHEPEDLVMEVSRFARQRPMAFLAVAAGLGFLAGRVARSMKDDTPTSSSSSTRPRGYYAAAGTSRAATEGRI